MPSLKIARVLLAPDTQEALSLPITALILGAVSQVDSLMELADRICDPIFRRSIKATTYSALDSPAAGEER
jgi:hypothetical protein